ncbi:MAG: hypothetical protein ACLP8X_17010 [Streptosporangiaceae bacterium]
MDAAYYEDLAGRLYGLPAGPLTGDDPDWPQLAAATAASAYCSLP